LKGVRPRVKQIEDVWQLGDIVARYEVCYRAQKNPLSINTLDFMGLTINTQQGTIKNFKGASMVANGWNRLVFTF